MLTIRCPCGEVFHADDRHIGYHVRCFHCGQVLPIALPGSKQVDRPSTPLETSGEEARGASSPSLPYQGLGGRRALVLLVVGFLLAVGLAIGLSRTPSRDSPDRPAPPAVVTPPEAPPSRSPASLPNGTIVYRRPGQRGIGRLSIHNGTRRDAVVSLLDPAPGSRVHLRVYVRAGQQAEAGRIDAAVYRVRFMLGADWQGKRFARERSTSEFLNLLDFTETDNEYREWKLTLHPVPGGRAKTKPVPDSDLDREDEDE